MFLILRPCSDVATFLLHELSIYNNHINNLNELNLCMTLRTYVSQPKHPWCKKSCSQDLKKGCAEKDVKSKWAAKASCC